MRAKNLCLIFFVLLNVFLFIMINVSKEKYKLDDEKSILELLDKNNIKCDKIMTNFRPKKQLVMSEIKIDREKLIKIFFDSERFSYENNCVKNENRVIKFLNNGFECEIFVPKKHNNEKEIIADCNSIVKKIKEPNTNFVLDLKKNDDEIIEYRQKYHSMIILNNFVRFEILDGCIKKIIYEYKNIGDFFGPYYEIVSPDRILFAFMKNDDVLKKNQVTINKFDLVYKITDLNLDFIIANPCYRLIYNKDFEIIFDAYTGEICS